MEREQYIRIMDFVRSKRYGTIIIYIAGKVMVYLTAVMYLLTIASLVYKEDMRFIRIIAVPAASFVVLSVYRAKYNAIRPYEKYNFKPLFPKDTCGKSFPSRHVFSIFPCQSLHSVNFVFLLYGYKLLKPAMLHKIPASAPAITSFGKCIPDITLIAARSTPII